jgi:DNA-binding GntR family transcriptional regulator
VADHSERATNQAQYSTMSTTQTQTEKSYARLREKLAAGQLAPGQRLVNRALADEFGVSVIPLREAINRLASEGIVKQISGSGAFVHSPDERELQELLIFRESIKSTAAAEAARHISDRELDALQAVLDDGITIAKLISDRPNGRATKAQLTRWIENEERFHFLIVEASRNRFLARSIQGHRVLERLYGPPSANSIKLTTNLAKTTCENHRQLIAVLRRRDPDAARRTMSDHVCQMRTVLENRQPQKVSP